jgi:hypothetical protein
MPNGGSTVQIVATVAHHYFYFVFFALFAVESLS